MGTPIKDIILKVGFSITLLHLLVISCSTEPIFNSEKYDEVFFVKCLLQVKGTPGSDVQSLSLSKIRYLVDIATSNDLEFGVDDAIIRVYSADTSINFTNVGGGYYEAPIFARKGEKYFLDIQTQNGEKLSATTYTPDSVSFSNISQYDTLYINVDSLSKEDVEFIPLYAVSNSPTIIHYSLPDSTLRLHPYLFPYDSYYNPIDYDSDNCYSERSNDLFKLRTYISDSTISFSGFSYIPSALDTCGPTLAKLTFSLCDEGWFLCQDNQYGPKSTDFVNDYDFLENTSNISGGYGQFGTWASYTWVLYVYITKELD